MEYTGYGMPSEFNTATITGTSKYIDVTTDSTTGTTADNTGFAIVQGAIQSSSSNTASVNYRVRARDSAGGTLSTHYSQRVYGTNNGYDNYSGWGSHFDHWRMNYYGTGINNNESSYWAFRAHFMMHINFNSGSDSGYRDYALIHCYFTQAGTNGFHRQNEQVIKIVQGSGDNKLKELQFYSNPSAQIGDFTADVHILGER